LQRHLPSQWRTGNERGMPKSVVWNPGQYLKFEDERTRPGRDLLAQVWHESPGIVIDAGCGPGNSTELLAERWPDAAIRGFDTSETMLAEARKRLPKASFEVADAANWLPPAGTGVVFANAVYQWIPGHKEQFARIVQQFAPGAVLAVQMPDNLMEPMHVLMREIAARPAFVKKLAGAPRGPLPKVGSYYDALNPHARRVDIWHSVYNHVMDDALGIVEWIRGTGLNPFLQRLDPDEQQDFLAAYTEEIERAYPRSADGKVLMAFPRIFIIAER
jgi:trans-aconitate 2-methyltransferase